MSFKGIALALALLVPAAAYSQGYVHGSLESNTVYDDDASSPYHGFHSNNYLRLDADFGSWAIGLQGEWYPSPLPGYDLSLQGIGLPMKYLRFGEYSFSFTIGDFYDQFGSGLVLRSWEDRDLGIANSIGGVRLHSGFFRDRLSLTLLTGAPRQGLGYAKSNVTGADANLTLGPLTLGSSLVARTERNPDEDLYTVLNAANAVTDIRTSVPGTVFLYSGRASLSRGTFSADAEIVLKSQDVTAVHNASTSDSFVLEGGRAFLGDLSYYNKYVIARATYRYLYNMDMAARRTLGTKVLSNTLNYLPALCKQQTYMLASLNPYETYSEGESGFSGDIYLKRIKGFAFRVGGSWIDGLGKVLPLRENNHLAYRDIYINADYRWSKKLNTTLYISIQENSPTHGNRKATNAQNVFVLDGTYKYSKKYSLHTELQYLYSQELTKDWMAGLVEFGMAPNWSFTLSDMYNHGSTKQHYWNVGASYTRAGFHIMAGYGRNREGMICSGGVCRYQPEYKGAFVRARWYF